MKSESTNIRKSYTLFSVTREDRKSRSQRIRGFFQTQPALAYLTAAFDFEWTVRRAILLMSKCPIPVIKARFDIKLYAGWNEYQDAWRCCVQRTRNDGTPTLEQVVFGGLTTGKALKEMQASLKKAMVLRHRLVHGLSGSIPTDEADEKFDLLLTASESLTAFVDSHADRPMFSIANGPLAKCSKCPKRKRCKFQREKKTAKERAKIKRENSK